MDELQKSIKEKLKEENLTWAKMAEACNYQSRSGFRSTFFRWLSKADNALRKIGYQLVIVKINDASK